MLPEQRDLRLRNLEGRNEVVERLFGHRLAARQCFQLLVRLGHRVSSHDRLDRLRENLPGAVDISGDTGTLTITNLLPSQDRRAAHFDVNGLESGKRYEVKVTVTTSDAQTLTGRGVLRVD